MINIITHTMHLIEFIVSHIWILIGIALVYSIGRHIVFPRKNFSVISIIIEGIMAGVVVMVIAFELMPVPKVQQNAISGLETENFQAE